MIPHNKSSARRGAMLILGILLLLMFSKTPFPSVSASSSPFGNANPDWLEVGPTCNVAGAVYNEVDITSAFTSAHGYGSSGDWTWQVNVNTVQPHPPTEENPTYQFTAAVLNYKLLWFTVEVIFPANSTINPGPKAIYSSQQKNVTGSYYVNDPNHLLTFEAYPTLTNGVLTNLEGDIFVNGAFSTDVEIPILTSDPNPGAPYGLNDQSSPAEYQNVLVGDPEFDSFATFLNGAGYFYSYPITYGVLQPSTCYDQQWSWFTVEDSNMYYATGNPCTVYTDSPCTQDFSVQSNQGGSGILVQAVDQDGSGRSGYYSQVDTTGGTEVAYGFSPSVYVINYNGQFEIYSDSYGACTFQKWADGSANPDVFTAQGQEFIADYECSNILPNVYVQTVNQNGGAITGYDILLYYTGSGSTGHTGFSPYNFYSNDFTVGDGYSVYADSFGSCTFSNWQGGSGGPYEFTATTSTSLTLTAVYNCTT